MIYDNSILVSITIKKLAIFINFYFPFLKRLADKCLARCSNQELVPLQCLASLNVVPTSVYLIYAVDGFIMTLAISVNF